jgi:hypothetical protein
MSKIEFQLTQNSSIENAWYETLKKEECATVWEDIVGRTPSEQWSPDRKIVQNVYNQKTTETTLAEVWMSLHRHNTQWEGFMDRVISVFPGLMPEVVVKAAVAGMGKVSSEKDRYKAFGSEELIKNWLERYKEAWVDNQEHRNRLLTHAVNAGFGEITTLLLACGANPQKALYATINKKSFDVLVAAGADPTLPLDGTEENLFQGWRSNKVLEEAISSNSTVMSFLSSRADQTFEAAKDRDAIIGWLNRAMLKTAKKNENSASDEEKRAEMLEGLIKNARKTKEVVKAVKSCLPAAWDWKFEGGKSLLMLLSADRANFDATVKELKDKIPEQSWRMVDDQGLPVSAYVMVMQNGLDEAGGAVVSEAIVKNEVSASVICDAMLKSLEERLNSSDVFRYPGVELLSIVDIKEADIWNTLKDNKYDVIPKSWMGKELSRMSFTISEGVWLKALSSMPADKAIYVSNPGWGSFACYLDISKTTSNANIWSDKKEDVLEKIKRVCEKWSLKGVDITDTINGIKSTHWIRGSEGMLLAIAERNKLGKHLDINLTATKKVKTAL